MFCIWLYCGYIWLKPCWKPYWKFYGLCGICWYMYCCGYMPFGCCIIYIC